MRWELKFLNMVEINLVFLSADAIHNIHPKTMLHVLFFICKSTNGSTIITNIFKLLGSYMFRQHCVILRELAFITLPNYISTIAALLQLYLCNLVR